MKNFFKFILVGLLFASFPGEIANQLIVHKTLSGFAETIAIYIVLLSTGYFISKLFKRKLIPTLLYFILFGIIGLLIEYFVLGQGPEASAVGMFTFWAFLFTLPRIFTDGSGEFVDLNNLNKNVIKYWLISSPLVLIVFLIPNVGTYFGIILFIIQLLGFYVFYVPYLRHLYKLSGQKV